MAEEIKIGHAIRNEKGSYKGGKKGDQTKKEILIAEWYLHLKGWVVIRAKDPVVRENIARAMEMICQNENFGYGQDYRLSGYNEAAKVGFDPSKVKVKCGLDCSQAVRLCVRYAGIKVENFRTRTQQKVLKDTDEFEILTSDKYCKSSKYLKRGDILLTKKVPGHTVVVLEDGAETKKGKDEGPMAKKVFLSAGHGGSDPGACGNGLKEKDINLVTLKVCRDELERHGVEVVCSREKDENDPVSQEVKEANASNADLAVSFHVNAGGGDGFEAFCNPKNKDAVEIAEFAEAYVKELGQNSRGIKNGMHLYFIKNTKVTAVLFESFFIDNAKDKTIGDTTAEQKKFGVAYAKAILKHLGIKYKKETTSSSNASSAGTTGKLYRVQVGAYSKKENAESIQKKLKEAGYDAIIVTA